jgi:hypothetical protein
VRRFGFQSWDDGTRLYRARAEARPSCPILSFAWNHVGASVWCRCKPTRPNPPDYCSPSPAPPHRLNRPPSFALRFLLVLILLRRLLLCSSSSSSFSTSSYCYCCCCCCCRCRYSFATLGLPPTACYLPPSFASQTTTTTPLPTPPPRSRHCWGDAHIHTHTRAPSPSMPMSSSLFPAVPNLGQSREILIPSSDRRGTPRDLHSRYSIETHRCDINADPRMPPFRT